LKLFAGDTNLFMSDGIDKSELCTNCNISLESLNRWLVANRLSMNRDKTNITVFPSNKKKVSVFHLMQISSVTKVSSCRYLDLHIHNGLNWKTHIEYICNKLIKFVGVGISYKLRNKLPSRILQSIYFAIIHPHLLYGIEMYTLIPIHRVYMNLKC